MASDFSVKGFIFKSGERYCLLFDGNKNVPMYYPNLFITSQLRNRSLSYSTMEGYANGMVVLYRFMQERKNDLEDRFRRNYFFEFYELEALVDFCQIRFSERPSVVPNGSIFNLKELQESKNEASKQTQYIRITGIANYLEWLASRISHGAKSRDVSHEIILMIRNLKDLRPKKNPFSTEGLDKYLPDAQIEFLFEIFRPDSDLNPFFRADIRARNRLMFLMLFYLGIRRGELLNIRIKHINFSTNQISIQRDADQIDDPRKHQPLSKTKARTLPVKETLMAEIHKYVITERNLIPKSKKHDYLFISHRKGKTQGQPLSISSYKQILEIVRSISPALVKFVGHQLRHHWNYRFSELMDSMDKRPSESDQEKLRSYLMGWMEGSGTASTYNKRFIREKAQEASLTLQDSIVRAPKNMKEKI